MNTASRRKNRPILHLLARRLLAGVAALAVAGGPPPAEALCAYDGPCGDVNASGGVTSADALLVLKSSVGQPVALQCAATGGANAVPLRSGQIECFDAAGDEIACEGSRQDGETQAGYQPSFIEQGDGTILDEGSGLVWEMLNQLGTTQSIHRWDAVMDWSDAQAKVDELNSMNFAGYDDWRLPNIRELETLVAFGVSDPAVHASFDKACILGCNTSKCSCTKATSYWSSTTQLELPSRAWTVSFFDGTTSGFPKTNLAATRAVRGPDSASSLCGPAATPSALTGCMLAGPCGDVNDSGAVTAADAQAILRNAVRQPVVLECPVVPGDAAAEVLKTGQQTCHAVNGATIGCAGTGQDGEFLAGVTTSFLDHGNGTISDEATGLTWEKLDDAGGIHDKDGFATWEQVFAKIDALNASAFAGQDDWRLPNVRELQTLVRFGTYLPSVPPEFDDACTAGCTIATCSCTPSNLHWSSTTNVTDPSSAWIVDFYDGFTGGHPKEDPGFVYGVARAVRGGS